MDVEETAVAAQEQRHHRDPGADQYGSLDMILNETVGMSCALRRRKDLGDLYHFTLTHPFSLIVTISFNCKALRQYVQEFDKLL